MKNRKNKSYLEMLGLLVVTIALLGIASYQTSTQESISSQVSDRAGDEPTFDEDKQVAAAIHKDVKQSTTKAAYPGYTLYATSGTAEVYL